MFQNRFPLILPLMLTLAAWSGSPVRGETPNECIRSVLGLLTDFQKPIKESKGRILCDQIRELLNRTAPKGHPIGGGRNIAVAQYSINGVSGTRIGVSGTMEVPEIVPVPKKREFTTILDFSDRSHDAEVKILESLNQELRPGSSGVIRLYSERAICKSCSGVIRQFQKKFPKIEIVITTGAKK